MDIILRFEGIITFPGQLKIYTNPNIPPLIHAARRVAIHIRAEVADELQSMINNGSIVKVEEPTKWVSSLTYIRKSTGKLRICLDPKDLNKAVMRPHYTC